MDETMTTPAPAAKDKESRRSGEAPQDKGGLTTSLFSTFSAASNTSRALFFSVALIACGSLFWVATKGTAEEQPKRVRFADDDAEWRESLVAAQQREDETRRQRVVAEIEHFLARMKAVSEEIAKVDAELKETGGRLNTLAGDDSVGYDTSLSEFESEQSIDKAFMTKDDIDKKRGGILHLAEELGLHRKFLVGKYNETVDAVKQMGMQYQEEYGEAPPVHAATVASPQTPRTPA